jgi:hypothetical protein
MKRALLLTLAVVFASCLTGCSNKADENKPLDQVTAEAQKMSVDDLKATATKYKDAITAKMDEVKALGAKINPQDLLSGKAKDIQDKIAELNKSVTALTERYQVYLDELKKKGGDITGLKL